MQRFSADEIVEKMEATAVVPVFFHQDVEVAIEVLKNSYEAGIRVFEFTNRGSNALDVFSQLVEVTKGLQGLVLGIGTIWSVEDAEKFMEAGADFVVSPGFVEEIGQSFSPKDVLWIPGCGSVTEVFNAHRMGARLIKIFPGNVLGPKFAASVKSVLPSVKLMPTGGVKPTANNLGEWFGSGVSCVGMGSQLISKSLIAAGNFSEVQDEISDALSLVKTIRQNV